VTLLAHTIFKKYSKKAVYRALFQIPETVKIVLLERQLLHARKRKKEAGKSSPAAYSCKFWIRQKCITGFQLIYWIVNFIGIPTSTYMY
jgi:hypothetical protein